jgi:hypothetical protein
MDAVTDPTTETNSAPRPETEPQARPRKRGGGPRTPEGKRASCANAIKDSLRSKTVFTGQVAAAIVERTRTFTAQ